MELLLSAAEMCLAPSSPMLLALILRARAKRTRQGVLTVGKRVCGDLPEGLQGGVRLQRLGDVLCTLNTNVVVLEPVNEGQMEASAGSDGREKAMRQHT